MSIILPYKSNILNFQKILITMSLAVSAFILTLLLILQLLLSNKFWVNQISLIPLESGFEALKPRLTLRSPYFFLAILFVLFDLELVLLFPWVVFNSNVSLYFISWGITIRLVFMTLALEWAWYGLKWQI